MENNNEFNYDKESIIYNSDGINFVLKNKNGNSNSMIVGIQH